MLSQMERREKHIRAVVKLERELSRQRWEPELHPLAEPYQKGWKRFYVLSERARKRPDREALASILPYLNSVKHHNRPDFKRRTRGRKRLVDIEQPLRRIALVHWYRQRFPGSWLKYFRLVRTRPECGPDSLEFAFPTLYELRIEERWITHVKVVDPLVVSQSMKLEQYAMQHHIWERYARLKGRSWRRWFKRYDPRQRVLAKVHQQEIRNALSNDQAADLRSPIRWTPLSRLFRFCARTAVVGFARWRANGMLSTNWRM